MLFQQLAWEDSFALLRTTSDSLGASQGALRSWSLCGISTREVAARCKLVVLLTVAR
jgi:hypothetical protein